jgi:hypothetical protein
MTWENNAANQESNGEMFALSVASFGLVLKFKVDKCLEHFHLNILFHHRR